MIVHMLLYFTLLYSTLLYFTLLYSTLLYFTLLYSTLLLLFMGNCLSYWNFLVITRNSVS
jgi:hypothetical protein